MRNSTTFAEWMFKIKNVYYHDNQRMTNAFEKIQQKSLEDERSKSTT